MLWKTIEGNIRLRLRVRFLLLYSELCPTGPWCNMLQTLIERKKIWGGNVRWILSIITLYESPKMEKNNKLRNKTNFRFVMKFLTFSCLKLATKPCLSYDKMYDYHNRSWNMNNHNVIQKSREHRADRLFFSLTPRFPWNWKLLFYWPSCILLMQNKLFSTNMKIH